MSSAENINVNGSMITASILRIGFRQFPQSIEAWVPPALWPQIAPIQIAEGYPFRVFEMGSIPTDEIWFVGTRGEVLGRVVNIAATPGNQP